MENPFAASKHPLSRAIAPFFARLEPGTGTKSERSWFFCQTPNCPGQVRYRRLKAGGRRLCQKCHDGPNNPFEAGASELAKAVAPFFKRSDPGKGGKAHGSVFYCLTAGCDGDVPYYRLKARASRLCAKCRENKWLIDGKLVRDSWVHEHAEKYSHSEYRGKYLRHYMRCDTPGCPHVCFAPAVKETGRFACRRCADRGRIQPLTTQLLAVMRKRHFGTEPMIDAAYLQILLDIGTCGYCLRPLVSRKALDLLNQEERGCQRTEIDRMDNSKGYVRGNCVPCCWPCNGRKNAILSAQWALCFQVAARGHPTQAILVAEAASYEDGLSVISVKQLSGAAKRVLQGLRDARQL